MRTVTGHDVGDRQVASVLEHFAAAAERNWEGIQAGDLPLRPTLARMSDDFVNYYAARAARDPQFRVHDSRADLEDAAACALGVLDLGVFPRGDWSVRLNYFGETISNADTAYDETRRPAHPTTARTWTDAFELSVASGLIRQWRNAIGLVLRANHAEEIRAGLPYAQHKSVSGPSDLAQMNALCGYMAPAGGHLPRDWPTVPLQKPSIDERLDAALELDAVGPLSADQRLLRVLLTDNQAAFEDALYDHLSAVRAAAPPDGTPAGLLPLGAITLAALAVQAHQWDLALESDYLFPSHLREPEGARTQENDCGGWTAAH